MRRPFLFTGLILGVLVLAPPVAAVSYSASVSLDLTSLTFSGIPVSLTTVIPPGTFDRFINSVEAEQRNTLLIEHSRNAVFLHHDIFPRLGCVGRSARGAAALYSTRQAGSKCIY